MHCYFEEPKIDCAIDKVLFKERVENVPLGGSTMRIHFAYYTHGSTAAHKNAKYTKLKDYSAKECRLYNVFCRLHKYENVIA